MNNTRYQSGHWIDLNGDGRKDLLTARTDNSAENSYLVWLEHPATGDLDDAEWTEHVITQGPDVQTFIYELPAYPGELVVFAPLSQAATMAVYIVSLTDGTLVDSRVIDDDTIKLGGTGVSKPYASKLVDLNGDGKHQLLVNSWDQ